MSGKWKTKVPFEIRFWSLVTVGKSLTGCWPWRNKENRKYARVKKNGKYVHASKTAWELYYKKKWPNKALSCHTCNNNKMCCNPTHVYPGDHSTNAYDWWASRGGKHSKKTLRKMKQTHLRNHRLGLSKRWKKK